MNERTNLTATLVEIAHYYYEENMSQQEIADRLAVSRSLIALYIKKAREQGIVKIEIIDPKNNLAGVEALLQQSYGLQKVSVLASAHHSLSLTRRALGSAAARYLDEILRDGDVFGLGWGGILPEMASLMAPARPKRLDVIPLSGESSSSSSYSQLNQLILQVAQAYSSSPYFLLAPILLGSHSLRDALMQDAAAIPVVERWQNLSVACVGIGSVSTGEEDITQLLQLGASGHICAHYFDRQGHFLNTGQDDRLLTASLPQLRKARHVVALATGAENANAVLGALRTHLITDLFMDESLAQVLLKETN